MRRRPARFSDLAPHPQLVATLELAYRVGKVTHAITGGRSDALGNRYPGPSSCLRLIIRGRRAVDADDDFAGRAGAVLLRVEGCWQVF